MRVDGRWMKMWKEWEGGIEKLDEGVCVGGGRVQLQLGSRKI